MSIKLHADFSMGNARANWRARRVQGVGKAFNKMKRYMGAYPDAAVQTKPVNDAFYKASLQYAKGIRTASRNSFKNDTGRLRKSIRARRGRAAYRPSAMLFAGGAKKSYHRRFIDRGKKNRDGSRTTGKPYVGPGIIQSNTAANHALVKHIQANVDQVIRDANRIASRG